jgi:hypothetical protein
MTMTMIMIMMKAIRIISMSESAAASLKRAESMSENFWRVSLAMSALSLALLGFPGGVSRLQADEEPLVAERPPLVTERIDRSIKRGLDWLKANQSSNGSWSGRGGEGSYPTAMTALAGMGMLGSGSTATRGPYARQIARSVDFLLDRCARSTGLICAADEYSRSMYGHGFSMLYLASVYGMEPDLRRQARIKKVLSAGIKLIAKAQSAEGGWLYTPDDGGDEGSVTVTQVQALRACRNAGLTVPKKTIDMAIRYIERSQQPDGGIAYRVGMSGSRPPISAAAVAVLYNAGKYDSPMAAKALKYCKEKIAIDEDSSSGWWGHFFYSHLYMSQAMYQAGEKEWTGYYPRIAKALVSRQGSDGSWDDSGVGKVYGTAIALTILQLPHENLPIYGR